MFSYSCNQSPNVYVFASSDSFIRWCLALYFDCHMFVYLYVCLFYCIDVLTKPIIITNNGNSTRYIISTNHKFSIYILSLHIQVINWSCKSNKMLFSGPKISSSCKKNSIKKSEGKNYWKSKIISQIGLIGLGTGECIRKQQPEFVCTETGLKLGKYKFLC